jgi:hypothetical protein
MFVIFLLNKSVYVMKLYNQNNPKLYFKEQWLLYAQLTLTFKNVEFFPLRSVFMSFIWLPEWTAISDLNRINKFNLVI